MAEFPALPLWTDAYLGDTVHLDATEHGAYLMLLICMWRTDGTRLPNDDKLLAKYARCSPKVWKRLRPILEPFFITNELFWTQLRLRDEMQFVTEKRSKQAANGRASALKRKNRHLTKRPTKPHASDQPIGNQSATPTPTPTPTIPLAKANGRNPPDSDREFWANAKAYLEPYTNGDPGALVGKWLKVNGRETTGQAIAASQMERAVDPIAFVEGYFRKRRQGSDNVAVGI